MNKRGGNARRKSSFGEGTALQVHCTGKRRREIPGGGGGPGKNPRTVGIAYQVFRHSKNLQKKMPAVIGTLSIAALQALTAAKEPRELRF